MSDLSGVSGHGPDTVRDTRQTQQDNQVSASQFSRQGQCGKRNAHGVTGRINNPAQTVNEGDTEFGKYEPIFSVDTQVTFVPGEYPWH